MSGEGQHSSAESGSHHGDNGRTNPGFDDPLMAGAHGSFSDTYPHGGSQPTDWKKYANETMEDYLSRCPGAHQNEQPSSSGAQSGEQFDHSVNVCYLIVIIKYYSTM